MITISFQYNELNHKNTAKGLMVYPLPDKKYKKKNFKRSINTIKRLFSYFISIYIDRLNKCKYIHNNKLNDKNSHFLQEFQKRLIIVQTIGKYTLIQKFFKIHPKRRAKCEK